ncbi:MAG: CofH family radical SAM protein [Proteobacteria bacterium]|nr:CofH family radical SAM protein [Pseudomonadota bacterium]
MMKNHEKNPLLLLEKIKTGLRVTPEEALDLYSWDLPDLARAGDDRRRLCFPAEDVGFIIDRIINFTNVCEAECRFCAFHARADQIEPFSLSLDDILKRVEELRLIGGSQVMLQGGLNPDYTFDMYIDMVKTVKKAFPDIFIHSFSPAELFHMARKSDLSLDTVVASLKEAGLDSVPGASDLLVERIRKIACAHKISVADWLTVIKTLARHDMKSSATMTYGMGETQKEQIDHLKVIRDVQDETGIIRAFIPWSFSPFRTGMDHITPATGIDYLKIVAIGRIFLDNVTHIQAGWLTEGLKMAQLALAMGANDMGGILMEETVVKATGITTRTNQEELIVLIRNACKTPVLRDSAYNVVRRFQ